jgi:hypothetical protein
MTQGEPQNAAGVRRGDLLAGKYRIQRVLGAVFLLALSSLASCNSSESAGGEGGAGPACSTVPACGGDPVGTWQVTAGCFEFPAPTQCPGSLGPYAGDAGVTAFNGPWLFGTPRGRVLSGNLTFRPDGTYDVGLDVAFSGVAHFPPLCFQAYALPVSCDTLASALSARNGWSTCAPASDGGCDCQYAGGPGPEASTGKWVRLGNGSIQTDGGDEFEFCVDGNRMDITSDYPYVFGVPLQRTLTLARVTSASEAGGLPQSTSSVIPTVEASAICPSADACGGDPTGGWSGTVCLTTPLPPIWSTPDAPCENLIYLPAVPTGDPPIPITNVALPGGGGTVQQVSVTFNADRSYGLYISRSASVTAHFAPYCLTAWGANQSCKDLEMSVVQVEDAMPNYQNIACTSAADGGCDCTYTFESATADIGSWSVDGTGLTLASTTPYGPTEAVFCKNGSQLQITTAPGSSLSGLGPGTLTLRPWVSDCPDLDMACAGICVDMQTDPKNCGACVNACSGTADGGPPSCSGGVCAM